MKHPGKNFKGQLENEDVISYFRHHWILLLPDVISFGLFLAIIVLLAINISSFNLPPLSELYIQEIAVLTIVATGFVIHRFFVRLLAHAMNFVIITNLRIIEVRKTLFARNDQESIYMRNIQDIQKHQDGFIKNLCSFGDLSISSYGSEPIIISTVPHPDRYFRLLNKVKNESTFAEQIQTRTPKGIDPRRMNEAAPARDKTPQP
ncbi:MAG TPA: hypothetical protein VI588_02335 [Candidatus Gracilibacteria bacterium]|nr:hypothetical protein [Candidatus Gracilibacteria bacterium]